MNSSAAGGGLVGEGRYSCYIAKAYGTSTQTSTLTSTQTLHSRNTNSPLRNTTNKRRLPNEDGMNGLKKLWARRCHQFMQFSKLPWDDFKAWSSFRLQQRQKSNLDSWNFYCLHFESIPNIKRTTHLKYVGERIVDNWLFCQPKVKTSRPVKKNGREKILCCKHFQVGQ